MIVIHDQEKPMDQPTSRLNLRLPESVPAEERRGQTPTELPAQSLEDRRRVNRICDALLATRYAPLGAVEVHVQGQLVILRGRVPSYYLKQVAQSVTLAVAGGHQVRNELDVPDQRDA
jgi:osmotically-inducible protein OsmY